MVRRPLLAPVWPVLLLLVSSCSEDERKEPGPSWTSCETDGDCASPLPYCLEGVCVACQLAADCGPEAPACESGQCTSCQSDAPCEGRAGATRCNIANGTCVACLGDGDCGGATPRCAADHRCVECVARTDCPGGAECVDGACGETRSCTTGEDCREGEICVLVEGAVEGRCEQGCDPRVGGPCDAGELCGLVGFGPSPESEPIGICLPPNGGGGVDAPCGDGESFCEVGLVCVETSSGDTGGTCLALCDEENSESCGDDDRECVGLEVTMPVGAVIGACLPRSTACESDADCRDNEACVITEAGAGRITLGCVLAIGAKRAGEACAANAECASAFCVAGVCFGPCGGDPDCAAESACVDLTFTLSDGTSDAVPACLATCSDDASCGADRACLPWISRDRDRLATVCGPRRGPVGPGDACLRDEECRTGNCFTGSPAGYCMGICDGDEDCGPGTRCDSASYFLNQGPDGQGGTYDDVYAFTRTCVGIPCTADGDCAESGWSCTPMSGRGDAGNLELRCYPAQGDLRGGTSCVDDAECRSGKCFDPTLPGEHCHDGVDNDGNGVADCDDLACANRCHTEFACDNGLDDDGDGAIDCADGDCDSTCNWEGDCDDGEDEDGDNLVDCADPDCRYSCGLVELDCENHGDDDGDGAIDCRDDDCRYYSVCQEYNCENGIDDDGNGWVDCQDPDCRWNPPCNLRPVEGEGDPALCGNGLDDDDDGLVDCADPSCRDRGPCAEAGCAAGDCCHNGLDDDGDGAIDCADPDCGPMPGCHEADCADGVDDDGDGPVDCKDPDCANNPACNERNCGAGAACCENGLDDDNDGGVDCIDAQCRYTSSCHELYCTSGNCCADGLDSDRDGLVDCADPDCRNSSACREIACNDRGDGDGDGLVDCADPDCHGDSVCRAQWYICFEACTADADCPGGQICAPSAAGFPAPIGRGYFASCLPAPDEAQPDHTPGGEGQAVPGDPAPPAL
jgi:hypothetical protein